MSQTHTSGIEAFWKGFEKQAGIGHTVADVAGLSILMEPTIYKHVTGKKPSEKHKEIAEVAGLGAMIGAGSHNIFRYLKPKA